MTPNFSYFQAGSLQDALDKLGAKGTRLMSGGTDLMGCLRDRVFSADMVVSLSRLDGMRGVDEARDGGLRIGALTTVAELAENAKVKALFPGLAMAAGEVASPQLRNQGSVGGNLCQKPRCWYYRGEFHCLRKGGGLCYAFGGENQYHAIFGADGKCCYVHPSDIAPMLTALEASVRIMGPGGARLAAIDKFFVSPADDVERETVLNPDEIVTDVMVPKPVNGLRTSYRKIRTRRAWDFALAGVALALNFKGDVVERARVVFSGAAPIPWRSREVEEVITGQQLTPEVIAKAAHAGVKKAEPLQHNEYKIPLFRGVIEEELAAIGRAPSKTT